MPPKLSGTAVVKPIVLVPFVELSTTSPSNQSGQQASQGDATMKRRSVARLGYILAAGASLVVSVLLWFTGDKEQGVFVGIWVPSILSLGTLMLKGDGNE